MIKDTITYDINTVPQNIVRWRRVFDVFPFTNVTYRTWNESFCTRVQEWIR